MSDLRICNAVSLHPEANGGERNMQEQQQHQQQRMLLNQEHPFTRMCVLGCEANKSELCRFPVHDNRRCKHWLRHFGVTDQLVQELGGLQKLRICFRHFNQQKEMAKTRIKTTPLRATANKVSTANTTVITPVADSTTIELVSNETIGQKLQISDKSVTTITAVPQRSHSISSSASSDVQSINSDYEASLPLSTLVNTDIQAIAKGHTPIQPESGAKKRKLYLITEKKNGAMDGNDSNGQKKRKMFVVVEADKTPSPNQSITTSSSNKQIRVISDKSQCNLSEHFHKFLPEILSCIQDKQDKQTKQQLSLLSQKVPSSSASTAIKPQITLPPKKNPTNFIKAAPKQQQQSSISTNNTTEALSCTNGNGNYIPKTTSFDSPLKSESEKINETNINLSPDFRFLMKILPKLERLPEPQKQNVKRSIQIFVEKSFSIYGNKEE